MHNVVVRAIMRGLIPSEFKTLVKNILVVSLVGGINGLVLSAYGVLFQRLSMTIFSFLSERSTLSIMFCFLSIYLCFLASATLVRKIAASHSGSATNAFLRIYHFRCGYIRLREAIGFGLAALLTVLCGGSIGPEGPGIFLGAAIASFIARAFKYKPAEVRRLSIIGAAAGVSAIYRAPLAAMAFSLEIPYMRDVEVEVLVDSMIACFIAYIIAVGIAGPQPILEVVRPVKIFRVSLDLVMHSLIIGAIAAITSLLFIYLKKMAHRYNDLLWRRIYIPPLLVTLAIFCSWLVAPRALGVGEETIVEMIEDRATEVIKTALILLIAKIALTVITLEFGGSGGIFVPSVFIGATIGYAYAKALNLPYVEALTLAGIAGVFAGANKTLLTAVLFTVEALGFGGFMSSALAASFSFLLTLNQSLHASQVPMRLPVRSRLLLDTIHKVLEREPFLIKRLKAIDVGHENPIVIYADTPIEEILSIASEHGHSHYPVVDNEGQLLGYVNVEEAIELLGFEELRAADIMHPSKGIKPDATVEDILEMMILRNEEFLVVVDENKRPIAVITPEDMTLALMKHVSPAVV
ncbi:MAG: hypothetical protein DRN15_01315 [Thermoprotei archaeon]|nr:MAG: hypothetical protein DRM97_04120 [Thermoprotei archaeon]RLF24901.1 MAG: hypothetical protein DRN15_01315 [Thermoprotei archaeon]